MPCLKKNGSGLRALGAVLRTTLATLGHASSVEAAAHLVIAHARQILDTTPTDQNDRVLLQVVTLATDVTDDFEAVRQAHLRDLAQSRVWLLRCGRIDARANAAPLRAIRERRRRALVRLRAARLAYQLIDC